MNVFDVVILAAAVIAIVMGYRSGLLRSLATIIGYIVAVPVVLTLSPLLAPYAPAPALASSFGGCRRLVFFVLFLIIGMIHRGLDAPLRRCRRR